VTALHAGDAVVTRQPFVEERVVGAEQIVGAPVLADEAVEEELRLASEGLPEGVVEVREDALHRHRSVEVPQE
jgi:hypothetical protein